MLLQLALQEATAEEVQEYRKKMGEVYAESDKLDGTTVKRTGKLTEQLRKSILQHINSRVARGDLNIAGMSSLENELHQVGTDWIKTHAPYFHDQVVKSADVGDRLIKTGVTAAGAVLPEHLDLRPAVSLTSEDLGYLNQVAVTAGRVGREAVSVHLRTGRNLSPEAIEKTLGQKWLPAHMAGERAAKTILARAQADAAEERMRELADRTGGQIQKLFVYTTGRSQSCTICSPYNGQRYEVRDPTAPKLPLHANCRCSYVPWLNRVVNEKSDPVIPALGKGIARSERPRASGKPVRTLIDSPFDDSGFDYAPDALRQRGIPEVDSTSIESFLRNVPGLDSKTDASKTGIPTSYGKPLVPADPWGKDAIRDHIFGTQHDVLEGMRREGPLGAIPIVVFSPEFSGPIDGGSVCWIGRFNLGENKPNMFAVIIATEGEESFNLETFIPTKKFGTVRKYLRKMRGQTL